MIWRYRGLEIEREELSAPLGENREGFQEEVAFEFVLEGQRV